MTVLSRVLAVALIAMAVVYPASAAMPYGAGSDDTSVYALGSYVWNVVFLSDDVTWTDAQINSHVSKVKGAANYWMVKSRDRYDRYADLDITVNVVNGKMARDIADVEDVEIYRDAIDGVSFSDPFGGGDLTFSTSLSDTWEATTDFNNFTRDAFDVNWAFTTYVRPYGERSFAYLNGPFTVAHIDDGTVVYAHEAAHIFGAYDEYDSARSAYVGNRAGYLYTENTNAHWLDEDQRNQNPASTSSSIMKSVNNWNLLSGTAEAIGWRDGDNDRIPDILDTFPVIQIDNDLSVPVTSDTVLSGSFRVNPMESPNPEWDAITINTIKSAYLDFGGGIGAAPVEESLGTVLINAGAIHDPAPEGADLTPVDGEWGDYQERFEFDLAGLAPGEYAYLLQVTNSVGNVSEQVIAFTIAPEPASLALMLLAGVAVLRRRG